MFEIWALESGFWLMVDGQIQDNPNYGFRTKEQVKLEFDDWKKRKDASHK